MRSNLGIYHLFGENNKAKKLFYEYCKNSDELCAWDLEVIENNLGLPSINNSQEYVYFSKGNILDFLEENGYYIGIPIRGKFKFVTCVYYKTGESAGYPIYNNSGVKERVRALELGISKALEHLEKRL